ncbi:MAG: hypothetical protein ABEL76_13790, partial [Bradymonadaceae bacterium]
MAVVDRLRKNAAAVIFVLAIVVLSAAVWAGLGPQIDSAFGMMVTGLERVLMLPIPVIEMPLVVFLLFFGALFFTFRFRFVNVRAFTHAIDVVRGAYDD